MSQHGLDRALDLEVWSLARDHGFLIVSKDADFGDLTTVRGFPPKVIWIRRGNCSTDQIENLLRQSVEAIGTLVIPFGVLRQLQEMMDVEVRVVGVKIVVIPFGVLRHPGVRAQGCDLPP